MLKRIKEWIWQKPEPQREDRFKLVDTEYNEPLIIITPDRKVTIKGDLYEAATTFWDCVQKVTPPEWTLVVDNLNAE